MPAFSVPVVGCRMASACPVFPAIPLCLQLFLHRPCLSVCPDEHLQRRHSPAIQAEAMRHLAAPHPSSILASVSRPPKCPGLRYPASPIDCFALVACHVLACADLCAALSDDRCEKTLKQLYVRAWPNCPQLPETLPRLYITAFFFLLSRYHYRYNPPCLCLKLTRSKHRPSTS